MWMVCAYGHQMHGLATHVPQKATLFFPGKYIEVSFERREERLKVL